MISLFRLINNLMHSKDGMSKFSFENTLGTYLRFEIYCLTGLLIR